VKVDKIDHSGKTVFVGIDVHLKTYSVVATGDHISRPIVFGSMPADPVALVKTLLNRFSGAKIKSAYEAGFSGFSLHRVLVANGIENIVVNPAAIPMRANERLKNDKRDATKISACLKSGDLLGIRVPSNEELLRRELSRTRVQLLEDRCRTGNRIKAKFRFHGIPLPLGKEDDQNEAESRGMSLALIRDMKRMVLPSDLKCALACLFSHYEFLSSQIRKLDEKIEEQAKKDEKLDALYQSVPGIGRINGRALANELGDMSQFPNERALFNFVGLIPSEHSTGQEKEPRRGHITRTGPSRIRWILTEAAWTAKRRDPDLESAYEKIKSRRGAKRAIVAIARKLLGRIRSCLLKGCEYKIMIPEPAGAV
jgi:transposase